MLKILFVAIINRLIDYFYEGESLVMKKIGIIVVNLFFLILLLFLIGIAIKKYLMEGGITLFVVSLVLLAVGLIFNWVVFNKYVVTEGKGEKK